MLALANRQREMLVDKLPDAANVGAGALFFGQFLGEGSFSPLRAAAGVGLWLFLMFCSFELARGK